MLFVIFITRTYAVRIGLVDLLKRLTGSAHSVIDLCTILNYFHP